MPTRSHALVRTCRSLALTGALAGVAAAVGCSSGGGRDSVSSGGPRPSGNYKCEAVSSAQVVVTPPVVDVKSGVMRLTGTVHRQAGVTGPLEGRVDVDLIGPDGLRLDNPLHCRLQPNTVPADPNQTANYAPTPFGYVPPVGTTLRARYVDRQAAILENLREGDMDYNGNGGHVGEDVPRSQENGAMPTNPTGGGAGAVTGSGN